MLVTISGQQVPVLVDSFSLDDTIGERSVCRFQVRDKTGLLSFRQGEPVIAWDNAGFRLFAGVISFSQRTRLLNSAVHLHQIECADNHYFADKRIIRAAYETMSAGAIARYCRQCAGRGRRHL